MGKILGLGEAGIEASGPDQLAMDADLHDAAGVEDVDPVGVANRRQAMGDDHGGAAGHQTVEREPHLGFAFGIEGAGGLVEQDDRRVLQKGASDGDPLALTAGEPGAGLSNYRFVTLGQGDDEVVRRRVPRRGLDFAPARRGARIGDVGGDRVVE